MKIQLLYFEGCPHAGEARVTLRRALEHSGLETPIEELDGDYPSPTVLIDGVDVMGEPERSGRMCRLDLPTESRIVSAIAAMKGAD